MKRTTSILFLLGSFLLGSFTIGACDDAPPAQGGGGAAQGGDGGAGGEGVGGEGEGGQGMGGEGAGGEGGNALGGLGDACADPAACASGYCADGVCCESACEAGACDGAGTCALGTLAWANAYGAVVGNGDHTLVEDLAVDASGIVVVGSFRGVVSFGGTNLVASAGNSDIFIAKYDLAGNHLWSKRFGTNIAGQTSSAEAVALAGSEIVVAGRYGGAAGFGVGFGGGPLAHAGGDDAFIVRLDEDGNHLWSSGYGGSGNDAATALSIAAGAISVGGTFQGAVDFGGAVLTAAGTRDAFVLRLDPAGSPLWRAAANASADIDVHALAVDSAGATIVTGAFNGTIDFGSLLTSAGSTDIYVSKLTAAGDHAWSRRYGDGASQQIGRALSIRDGEVIVAGTFWGTIDLGGGELVSGATTADVFVGALDAGGNHVWSAQFGDAGDQNRVDVATDDHGNVIVAGRNAASIDFGGGAIVSAGQGDLFLAKLRHDGEHLWSLGAGDALDQYVGEVAVSDGGEVIVAGKLLGTMDLGAGPLSDNGGGFAMFVAQFSP